VTVSFAAAVRELGYRDLSPDDLTRLRDHGVTASYIRRVNADGPPRAAEDIIRMRDRGEYPREARDRDRDRDDDRGRDEDR